MFGGWKFAAECHDCVLALGDKLGEAVFLLWDMQYRQLNVWGIKSLTIHHNNSGSQMNDFID